MTSGNAKQLTVCGSADFLDMLRAVTNVTQRREYEITHVPGTAELLETHLSTPFDYLLIEDGFEGVSADTIASAMRNESDHRPLIAVGPACDARVVTRYMRGGVDDYLVRDDLNVAELKESLRCAKEAELRRKSGLNVRQVVAQLRAADNYAQQLIDQSSDMIVAVDLALRITEFNRAAERVFGYSRDEMIGRHVSILYADPDQAWPVRIQTFRTGFVGEVRNRRRNGEEFISALQSCKVMDAHGELIGVIGMSREITSPQDKDAERRAVQDQIARRTNDLIRRERRTAELDDLCRRIIDRICMLSAHRHDGTVDDQAVAEAIEKFRADLAASPLARCVRGSAPVAAQRWFELWRHGVVERDRLTVDANGGGASIIYDPEQLSHVLDRLIEAVLNATDAAIRVGAPSNAAGNEIASVAVSLTISGPQETVERLYAIIGNVRRASEITHANAALLELTLLAALRAAVADGIEVTVSRKDTGCIVTLNVRAGIVRSPISGSRPAPGGEAVGELSRC